MPRFYITTAIDYVNGRPHIGHAYEKILADALARFHRQRGDATYFLTGTDEHGQKIAKTAAAAGKPPKAFVDEYAAHFKTAWKALDVSYDKFIRTTDQRHELAVQELFRRLNDARSPKTGEPVLFEEGYEGLYCEGCEAFKQEKDLDAKGLCPEHRTPPKRIKETNFFFRLSEYDEALLKHIENHPEFIEPDYRRNEVLNVIREGLQDVSVTRPSVPWGVPLPEEIPGAEGHTVYVWADALLNYLSAIGWPERRYSLWWLAKESDVGGPGAARQDEFQHLDGQGRPGAAWAGTTQPQYTNAFHLIGKDISRFHCVLWPALLLAAGVPLPRQVYVHGFINVRGEKLSKSVGNQVDPVEMARQFGADALRFYLLDAVPTGRDGEFTFAHFTPASQCPWGEPLGGDGAQVLRRRGPGRVGSRVAAGSGGSRCPPDADRGGERGELPGVEGVPGGAGRRGAARGVAAGGARERVDRAREALGSGQGSGPPGRARDRAPRAARDAEAGGGVGVAGDAEQERGAVGAPEPPGQAGGDPSRGGGATLRRRLARGPEARRSEEPVPSHRARAQDLMTRRRGRRRDRGASERP